MRDMVLSHCTTVLSTVHSLFHAVISLKKALCYGTHMIEKKGYVYMNVRNKPFIAFIKLLYTRGEHVDLALMERAHRYLNPHSAAG